jgi:hypothetical protein
MEVDFYIMIQSTNNIGATIFNTKEEWQWGLRTELKLGSPWKLWALEKRTTIQRGSYLLSARRWA